MAGNAGAGGGAAACGSNVCAHGACISDGSRRLCSCPAGVSACALLSDGTIRCWGNNGGHYGEPPAGTFASISLGGTPCALRSDGTGVCWGRDASGNPTQAPPSGTYKQIAGGASSNVPLFCAIRSNDTLRCWGSGVSGTTPTPPAGTYTQVRAGQSFACALRSDGAVACFGDDNGTGVTTAPGGTFVDVAALNDYGACALRASDRTAVCWGLNQGGQINPPATAFKQLTGLSDGVCGIRMDGTLECWGDDSQGYASPPTGTFDVIDRNCGIRPDKTVVCWGSKNVDGILTPPGGAFLSAATGGQSELCAVRADGSPMCIGIELPPPAGPFRDIAIGSGMVGLRPDGSVATWGTNNFVSNPPASDFSAIATALSFACGLRTSGALACWSISSPPTPPAGSFLSVATGTPSTVCGIRSDNTVTCTGGRAADPAGTFQQIALGGNYNCGIQTGGTLTCWYVASGAQAPPSSGTYTTLAIDGGGYACAQPTSGNVVCWGSSTLAIPPAPPGPYRRLVLGGSYACGIRDDDLTLTCWGNRVR
jgi:hypothetical protein